MESVAGAISSATTQRKHRAKIIETLEKELDKHPDKSATARWAIDLFASKRFKRYLTITEDKQVRIDRSKIREAERYDGKWVLETNDDTIRLEDAACGYKGLMVIERCFRALKRTRIKMCPMYHWVPRRIETHVRLCVLSLLIERVAEIACRKPWSHIRRTLETLQVTEFHTPDHKFFRRNEASKDLRQALKALDIPLPKSVLGIERVPESPPNM